MWKSLEPFRHERAFSLSLTFVRASASASSSECAELPMTIIIGGAADFQGADHMRACVPLGGWNELAGGWCVALFCVQQFVCAVSGRLHPRTHKAAALSTGGL